MKMIKNLNGGLYNLNSLSYINIELDEEKEEIFFIAEIENNKIKCIENINFDQIKKIGNEYIDIKYIADTTKKREYLKEITRRLRKQLYIFIAGENKIFCIESSLEEVMNNYNVAKKYKLMKNS